MPGEPLKMRRRLVSGRLTIELCGEVSSARCACLQNFWNKHCGPDVAEVQLDLRAVSSIDQGAWETLEECAGAARRRGVRVHGLETRP